MRTLRTRRAGVAAVLAMVALASLAATMRPAAGAPTRLQRLATPGKPLVLAHYYIWYTPNSWNRAKRDYPLVGRYASDDPVIIRDQIREAKSAGIDGFIVSWKSTDLLNVTLRRVVAIAAQEHFKLAITYEGRDFRHVPLPPSQIIADLRTFVSRFASSPVFNLFGRPLVVLSGTSSMPASHVRQITAPFLHTLLVLASESNVAGYERLARFVDGDLYYWSSVNPGTYPDVGVKLADLAAAVRARRGLWIAPAAPGFDARAVGGSTIVQRRDGATLRAEWSTALQTMPDAIGLISWNEFSENTYVEPSRRYGDRYLRVVAGLTGAPSPDVAAFDSDGPPGGAGPGRAMLAIGTFVGAALVLPLLAALRRRSARRVPTVDRP